MRGTTPMSPALLPGGAEAPEGLLRNSDRDRPPAPLAEPQGETAASPRPQRYFMRTASVSASAVSGLTGSTTTTWLDQLAVIPDGAGKIRRCVRRCPSRL